MNRQNFFGHLALALAIITVAAFAGQVRRWQHERRIETPRAERGVLRPSMGAPERRGLPAEMKALVRFRAGTSAGDMASIAARFGDQVLDQYEFVGGLVAVTDTDGIDEAELAAYRALAQVEYAEPNYVINLEPEFREPAARRPRLSYAPSLSLNDGPNDPLFGEQWSLVNTGQREGRPQADIGAGRAWARTQGSERIVIAVLDSGVDYTHPDLMNNMWVRPANLAPYADEQLGTVDDVNGYNAADNTGDPMDENGHGTHCAGIIGAEGNNGVGITGVNWRVEIMPLKFMSRGGYGTTRAAIEAINYVIARKRDGVNVRVISASWGSTTASRALRDAIKRAGEEGILFVAAAGNAGTDADRTPHYPASYDLPNVISVAAMNRRDELASFSNYGARRVHIAAPGAEILSTWLNGQYEEHSGTSMATPTVAGVAALILSVEPDLSVAQLRERLLQSVDQVESLRGRISSGGRLNAARAVGAE